MRFRTQLKNTRTFSKLTASLSSLGKVCWMRLEYDVVRFTVIPEQGTQVWAQIPVDTIFEESSYQLESNSDAINIEINISLLNRALRSTFGASSSQLRLTKKDKMPLLALTVLTTEWTEGNMALATDEPGEQSHATGPSAQSEVVGDRRARERETWITQEVPIKILHEDVVESLHEPHCPDPDVYIILPNLMQLKSISDRFTKLASSDSKGRQSGIVVADPAASTTGATALSTNAAPKLELSANMHGKLRLAIATDDLRIASVWSGLVNPPLDPAHITQDQASQLPSERMREAGDDDEAGWAKVRIDGKDWGRVLSVGRLSPKVVACFINETALVLYVYLPGSWNGEESCLTYYINSFTT
ncbi:cell cycle checkpoint protein [Penicillium brasilianum]|uniref:Checkpoint protein n=1 Tax=Penicillium brasilianum TaxID=104259 RepID=A0A1S9RXN0_PENBI|nr:cell cycle checkpoint protein [Penicillium brasilianum]